MTERANPNHPLFKILPGQYDAVKKAFGYHTDKCLNEALNQFEEWVQKQNHFSEKNLGRDYLSAYLVMAKGSTEKAKKRLDKRFTLRRMLPELFDNIDVNKDFVALRKCFKHAPVPVPTPDYYRVVVDRFDHNQVDFFNLQEYGRFQHVCAEYFISNDFAIGYEGVVDLRNVTVTDLMSKLNPLVLQKIVVMLVEGYGARIKATHVISESKFVDTIVGILKQGMSEKMARRIQIHTSPDTLTKFIPKECLPCDYGGTQKSVDELDEILFQQLSSETHRARLKLVGAYQTDETKRLASSFNEEYMGMPGSFRTLSVD